MIGGPDVWTTHGAGGVRAALFVAAVLSSHGELSHTTRSSVISDVGEFDIHDAERSLTGISEALAASGVAIRSLPGARSLRHAATRAEDWFKQGIYTLFRCTPVERCETSGAIHKSPLLNPLPEGEGASGHGALGDVKPIANRCTRQGVPRVLFAKGDPRILDVRAAAVLNSRKPRCVAPTDKWLFATRLLVEYARENQMAVVSSFGNLTYSVVSYLARGSPLIVVCDGVLPFMSREEHLSRFVSDYRNLFHSESTLFISSFPPGPLPPRSARLVERDRIVAGLASALLRADIRPGGNMEAILTAAGKRNIDIIGVGLDSGSTPSIAPISVLPIPAQRKTWDDAATRQTGQGSLKGSHRSSDNRTGTNSNPQTPKGEESSVARRQDRTGVSALTSVNDGSAPACLVHYTRSCPGPWPGQTIAEYCCSLIEGHGDAGHTGFDTLNRILREREIRGSCRMIRGTTPAVSFTERLPHDMAHLMKWRTGLARWTLEPYGIAISKEALLKLGVGQVIYGGEEVYAALPLEERYRFQLVDPACKDWSEEREWRLPGSLVFGAITSDDIIVLVRTEREAATIEDRFALTAIPVDDFKKTF